MSVLLRGRPALPLVVSAPGAPGFFLNIPPSGLLPVFRALGAPALVRALPAPGLVAVCGALGAPGPLLNVARPDGVVPMHRALGASGFLVDLPSSGLVFPVFRALGAPGPPGLLLLLWRRRGRARVLPLGGDLVVGPFLLLVGPLLFR